MHNLSLMKNKIMFSVPLLAIVASMSFMIIGSSTIVATAQQTTGEGQTNATIVRDSTAFLLSGEIIPAESFIHLYDSTPDAIALGHLAAKIPCDEDSNSTLTILTGVAPDFEPAELELVQNLSTPGELCLYHADLESTQGDREEHTSELQSRQYLVCRLLLEKNNNILTLLLHIL